MAYTRCMSMSESGLCPVCAQRGQKNDLQLFQINLHQAVALCSSKQCTYPLGVKPSPGLLVQRKATEIANLKRKKCRADTKTGLAKSRKFIKCASFQTVSNQTQQGSCQEMHSKTQVNASTPDIKSQFPAFVSREKTSVSGDGKHDSRNSFKLCNRNSHVPAGHPTTSSCIVKQELAIESVAVTYSVYPQWQNRDALCWLDVLLCLLVHSKQIRDHCSKMELSLIGRLIVVYDRVHRLLMNLLEQQPIKHESENVIDIDVVVGDVPLKTGGGSQSGTGTVSTGSSQADSSLHGVGDVMMQEFLDSLVIPGADSNINTQRTERENYKMSSSDYQTDSVTCKCFEQHQRCQHCIKKIVTTSTFKTIQHNLNSIRDKIWNCLQPKLKCQKGKNDSPVFALPLLVMQSAGFEALYQIQYRWHLLCEVCGYEVTDRKTKLFATFPNVKADFSMRNPYFERNCFKCGARGQRMNMLVDRYPKILVVYFVEGLQAGELTDQDFAAAGDTYRVSGVVQYTNKPDHFVCWVRSASGDGWMECDDLKGPLCHFADMAPSFPSSQVHMVIWERQANDYALPTQGMPLGTPGGRKQNNDTWKSSEIICHPILETSKLCSVSSISSAQKLCISSVVAQVTPGGRTESKVSQQIRNDQQIQSLECVGKRNSILQTTCATEERSDICDTHVKAKETPCSLNEGKTIFQATVASTRLVSGVSSETLPGDRAKVQVVPPSAQTGPCHTTLNGKRHQPIKMEGAELANRDPNAQRLERMANKIAQMKAAKLTRNEVQISHSEIPQRQTVPLDFPHKEYPDGSDKSPVLQTPKPSTTDGKSVSQDSASKQSTYLSVLQPFLKKKRAFVSQVKSPVTFGGYVPKTLKNSSNTEGLANGLSQDKPGKMAYKKPNFNTETFTKTRRANIPHSIKVSPQIKGKLTGKKNVTFSPTKTVRYSHSQENGKQVALTGPGSGRTTKPPYKQRILDRNFGMVNSNQQQNIAVDSFVWKSSEEGCNRVDQLCRTVEDGNCTGGQGTCKPCGSSTQHGHHGNPATNSKGFPANAAPDGNFQGCENNTAVNTVHWTPEFGIAPHVDIVESEWHPEEMRINSGCPPQTLCASFQQLCASPFLGNVLTVPCEQYPTTGSPSAQDFFDRLISSEDKSVVRQPDPSRTDWTKESSLCSANDVLSDMMTTVESSKMKRQSNNAYETSITIDKPLDVSTDSNVLDANLSCMDLSFDSSIFDAVALSTSLLDDARPVTTVGR